MQFIFNSLDELTDFLGWCNNLRPAAGSVSTLNVGAVVNEAVKHADAMAAAFAEHEQGEPQTGSGEQPAEESTKRKRRTKAEMEAARAAELNAGAETSPLTPGNASPASAGNPFASGESAGGATPFDIARATQAADATLTATTVLPASASTAPAGELSAKDHLDRCREFIGAKGLAAYNETFAKAGLTANVLAFTAEQRALHTAVLAAA